MWLFNARWREAKIYLDSLPVEELNHNEDPDWVEPRIDSFQLDTSRLARNGDRDLAGMARQLSNENLTPISEILDSIFPFRSIYETLPEGKWIRTLQLDPGDFLQLNLSGSFSLVDLTSNTTYSALSYVWGQNENNRRIKVNGKLVSIGENLYHALIHVQSRTKPVEIWADAICINQKSESEKNDQVAMM
jgi:hypothetical protein